MNDTYLTLPFPPTPEFAAQHAAAAVDAIRQVERVELDYTTESLAKVDVTIINIRNQRIPLGQIGGLIFGIGCYVGEIMVRECKGKWAMPCDLDVPSHAFDADTMLLSLPNGTTCNPIGKAFKRFENGEDDSLAYFYKVMTCTG